MMGEAGNANSDGGNAEALHRRRSNVATRRKPLAEIDEKEVRRAKRRKNKRVSFSETTTIALFNKDQNRDPNDSNDKSQLINQFQVASETIEGVLDTSAEAASKKINATIIDDRDMSVLSDSVLSDGGSSNPNRTLSMGSSDDSFQKAHNLMGELDITVFSANKHAGGGMSIDSDIVSDDSSHEAGGLTTDFDTTVHGSKTLVEASMCVNESMCDATRTASDSMSSLTGADGLLNEFDTTTTCVKPENRIDSTILTDETMCEVTRIMSDTSSFVSNDSSDGSSLETSGHGKINISVSYTSALVAQDFFKELDSSMSSDSFKISNQVEEGSCLETPASEMVFRKDNDVPSVESPYTVKPELPAEKQDNEDAKVTDELHDMPGKDGSHPPIDLESPISKTSLTLVSSLDTESENVGTPIKETGDNSDQECTHDPGVTTPSEQENSKTALLGKGGVDSANMEMNEVEDETGMKNEILSVTSIASDDLIETDNQNESLPLCKSIDVGPCPIMNLSKSENENLNRSQGDNSNPSSQKIAEAIEPANMSEAAYIENVNSCIQLDISAQKEIDPAYLSESPDRAQVEKQDLYTPLETGLSSANGNQVMEADLSLNKSSIQTLPNIQGMVVSRNEGINQTGELNHSTQIEAESSSANNTPSQALSSLPDAVVCGQDVSMVNELNLSMPMNADLISNNSPSGTIPDFPDSAVSRDVSMVDELNLSMPKNADLISKNRSSVTNPNLPDTADTSLVEKANLLTSLDTKLISKSIPVQTVPDLEDAAAERQEVNFIEEVNLSTQVTQKNTRESLPNIYDEAITENENNDKLGENLSFTNPEVAESTNLNNSLNNESDPDLKVNHNDTSWLSYGGLQDFQDTETEEMNDPVVNQMKQNLTAEVDRLMNCLSQNSLNVENWEKVKDDTVSDKIANTMSRITKLKAQNRLYSSQNLSYRHHSVSERSFVNTPNTSFPEPRKNDCTIQKTCGRENTSSMSSDSWIVEPTLNIPIANSTCLPEVQLSSESAIKVHSYEEIKKEMRQEEFPSACVVEFEDSSRIVIVIDQYAYHKFIIHHYSREITEIAIERKVSQGLEAEDYVVNLMADAISIPSLKTQFTTLCQIPELLHAICDSIRKWGPVARDIYRTFYKFLGRASLEKNCVVVKFFVYKILEVFSVILKFEEHSSKLFFVSNSRCEGIYEKVRETLHSEYDKYPFPFLSVCERVELLCSQLAEESPVVDTFPNTSWCHRRKNVLPKLGQEMDLDMDLLHNGML